MARPAPLAGVRVLEIGIAMAGPYYARLHDDLGAEVVKIERPDGGDESRRNKRSVAHRPSMTDRRR